MQIPVIENVLKLNDEVAALNRRMLKDAGVFTINLIGGPGCGKTALLEATLRQLHDELTIGVAVGDLATNNDGDRLMRHSPHVVQINTGRSCHLDANQVRQAMARLPLDELDVLVIENVGNLICPVGFDLGQDVKVGMFSVTDGDDKPIKHPPLTDASDVVLLNKIDLAPYVGFDRERFLAGVRQLNDRAPVFELAATKDQIDPWLQWIHEHAATPVGGGVHGRSQGTRGHHTTQPRHAPVGARSTGGVFRQFAGGDP